MDKNCYHDEYWLYQAGRLRRLRLPASTQNLWWWDENTLLIATPGGPVEKKLGQKGLPTTVLETRPLAGGKARELLRIHMELENAWPLPGGRLLLWAQENKLVENALATVGGNAEKAAALLEKERGCTVLEELPFWENGGGFIQGRRRLFLWDGAGLHPLTGEEWEVEQAAPAPGGNTVWLIAKEIVCHSPFKKSEKAALFKGAMAVEEKDAPARNQLLAINISGEKGASVCPGAHGLSAHNPRPKERDNTPCACAAITDYTFLPLRHDSLLALPDGGALVAGSSMRAHGLLQNPAFYRLFADGTFCILDDSGRFGVEPTLLTDVNLSAWDAQMIPYAGGAAFLSTVNGSNHIMAIGAESITQISKKPGAVCEIAPAENGFYAVAMRDEGAPEVYLIGEDGGETRLTHLNNDAMANTRFAPMAPLTVQNEGRDIQGWVLLPHGEEFGSLPAILYVHGGPKAAYGPVLFCEMQYWAAQGYAVLLCNPSGSDGYGDEFADIRGDYGGRDCRDLLAFLDAALAQTPAINPARLGLAGGSYGGFITNWLLGHSQRFKAAVSQRGISNWATMALLSDIGRTFVPDQTAMQPQEDAIDLMRRSPLAFAENIRTPTLLLHSDEDYRCPLPESLQLYAQLKRQGTPCRMVVFHGENHGLSRSGSPQNRLRRLREMTAWFARYL